MDFDVFSKKRILLTGGTGSFGRAFCRMTATFNPDVEIVVFSRDEMKQWEMHQEFSRNQNVKFVIGDVRDKDKLQRVMRGIDFVVHAAATKIVPTAEENPDECIKTNVMGAINVVEAAQSSNVSKVVALSTDKACNPINLYGASKLASDKIFVAANAEIGTAQGPQFAVVRYGNVMGSRGSVIPFFMKLPSETPLPITDFRMTRFMISLDSGVGLVRQAFDDMHGGEIFVKKIPSMKIRDIAEAVRPGGEFVEIGIRAGEKLHEQMVSVEDAPLTCDYGDYFKILPFGHRSISDKFIGTGKMVDDNFSYASNNNSEWMSVHNLRKWIDANREALSRFS